jgi:hypothetical protein
VSTLADQQLDEISVYTKLISSRGARGNRFDRPCRESSLVSVRASCSLRQTVGH